ncbi:hypothetical protein CTRI78_v009175 [Colletotrichum trifolii]|uniref:Uncharacterized protein n=1 Tax=Colletotrichum trifolii TaxID=5466 RepID=A0A4R8QT54_COLTR|nr:hypothetical protein CTRI78_v009175 [Colletotrichum trifolii]
MTSSFEALPYARTHVGPHLGSLRIGGKIRMLQCYAAEGEPREEFKSFISDIKIYLQSNLSKESTLGLVISLYMIGKQPSRTKPTILFVSDDKAIRKEAFSLIKDQSGIMEEHPGFELGHISLKAEFEGLQQMGDEFQSPTYWPQDVSFYQPESDRSSQPAIQSNSRIRDGNAEPSFLATATASGHIKDANPRSAFNKTTPPVVVEQSSSTGCRKLHALLDGARRSATAGGLVSFNGRLMFQTVQHLFEETVTPTNVDMSRDSFDENSDDECEITGWSDNDDNYNDDEYEYYDPDLVELTSRGSTSLQSGTPDSAASDTIADETSTVFSGPAQEEHAHELRSRLRGLVPSKPLQEPSANRHNKVTATGEVMLSSRELDFALVEVPPSVVPTLGGAEEDQSRPIPLEDYLGHIEPAPRDAAIRVATPEGGSIGGTLSGTPSLFRSPGSLTFIEVYTAKLSRSLVPGDCGSWLRDAVSGKVYGHVIAGSPSTGVVLIVPAHQVLRLALESLGQDLWDGATSEPVSDLAYAFQFASQDQHEKPQLEASKTRKSSPQVQDRDRALFSTNSEVEHV